MNTQQITQLKDILEKIQKIGLKEQTINLLVKCKEKFNERLENYESVMKLHKSGLGDRKIAKLTGISRNNINGWIYREVKPEYRLILPDAIDVIKKLKESGLNTVEIGNLLNVTSVTVGRLLNSIKNKYNKKTVLSQNVINFIKTSENPLEFLNYMWLVKINQKGLDSARVFCEFIKLQDKMGFFELCRELRKSFSTLTIWRRGKHVPCLINWLELYLRLGKPRDGYVWLPFSLDFRIDPFQVIEVPTKIEKWEDIVEVIDKLTPIEEMNFADGLTKEECFGFVLGMMIGDVGKRAERRDRLDLQLTTKSNTNMKLGNFFCDCVKRLGLRAYRTKNTRWFYRWVSQVSPFFNWIYKVVLGLDEKETTTYNAIKADWLLESPQEIVRRFLQGVYESDGYVSIDGCVGCAAGPNADIVQSSLKRFGIISHIRNEKYKDTVIYGERQFIKAHEILFAREIKTNRYMLLKSMVNAKKLTVNELTEEMKIKINEMKNKGYGIH